MSWYFCYDPKTGEYQNAIRAFEKPQFATEQSPDSLINPIYDMLASKWTEANVTPNKVEPSVETKAMNALGLVVAKMQTDLAKEDKG